MNEMYDRFVELHAQPGLFVMPNPFDVGSALRLEQAGFVALATTSAGLAWSIGKDDQEVTFEELLEHVAALTARLSVPLNVDSERLFSNSLDGVTHNVDALVAVGAAGCSIEDYDPATGAIDDIDLATQRVEAAAKSAAGRIVLTARCENYLYGVEDLDNTIERLVAYAAAGADCVYAPGVRSLGDIARVVGSVRGARAGREITVNVLALPGGPTVAELESVGVRRVSTGGALTKAAYGALVDAAVSLRDGDPT